MQLSSRCVQLILSKHARCLITFSKGREYLPKYGERGKCLKSDQLAPFSNANFKHDSIVVVAMSGGVDSSVTAALLAQSVGIAVSYFCNTLNCN
jgi:hypothetical protein